MAVRTEKKDELGPQLDPNDTIKFIENHRPGLPAGDYRLRVSQNISMEVNGFELQGLTIVPTTETITDTFSSEAMDFTVSGPRFTIQPDDIQGVFPPAGATGAFSPVLPHIILKRSTLPWERTAYRQDSDDPALAAEKQPPWLALLVFTQGEIQTGAVKNLTIEEAKAESTGGTRFPGLNDQSADPAGTSCTVIEVRWDVLQNLIPPTQDLDDLVHVRAVSSATVDDPDGEQAVVIANRLPKEETHVSVHLVSLEGLYELTNNDAEDPAFSFFYRTGGGGGRSPRPQDRIRLISLYNWHFFCQETAADNFDELFQHLNNDYAIPALFQLPDIDVDIVELDTDSDEVKERKAVLKSTRNAIRTGMVPLRHQFRYGDRAVSWYHGPLVPWGAPVSEEDANALWANPVRAADELVLFNEAQGLFDVSYAAAWELGRRLILENQRIASKLYDWKRRHAQFLICQAVHEECRHLPVDTNPGTPPPLDEEVANWFETQLMLLEGVPFNYLVPDERLLPTESIRFFTIDPLWLASLCDGAFSINRVTQADAERDLLNRVHLPSAQPMSGFLMRSKIVAGWPEMAIDAYSTVPDATQLPLDLVAQRLQPVRKEFLSPTVLMMQFKEHVQAVDFYLRPEAIHFGVQLDIISSTQERFFKKLRPMDGATPTGDINRVPFRNPARFRVIDVERMKSEMARLLGDRPPLSSEDFALQMIDGAPLVRLKKT